ncbi:MAG: hypothetical protein NUV97_00025 [archaeon]|nr:hypothetical protein [archaeon]
MYTLYDKVTLIKNHPDNNKYLRRGDTGTIIRKSDRYDWIVLWDVPKVGDLFINHSYARNETEKGRIWQVYESEITLSPSLTPEEIKLQTEKRVLAKIKYLDQQYKKHMENKLKKGNKSNDTQNQDISILFSEYLRQNPGNISWRIANTTTRTIQT